MRRLLVLLPLFLLIFGSCSNKYSVANKTFIKGHLDGLHPENGTIIFRGDRDVTFLTFDTFYSQDDDMVIIHNVFMPNDGFNGDVRCTIYKAADIGNLRLVCHDVIYYEKVE